MPRKLYARASKANTKRFCEARIQDQLTEIRDVLNVFHSTRYNSCHVLPAVHIDENNVPENNIIVEETLLYNIPNHQNEGTESSEYSSSNDLDDKVDSNIEYLRDRPVQDVEAYLLNFLKEWGVRDVSFHKIDQLLAGLRIIFPCLPKSYKTLLHTSRSVNIKEVGQGLMWYKTIKANLDEILTDDYLQNNNQIVMDINIDGVQLYKSTDDQFWPILGCLIGDRFPFIIGIWYGNAKPDDLEGYLSDFIAEVKNLTSNGYDFHGTNISFSIDNYILDAPARQFVKGIHSHNSTFCCEKCTVEGVRHKNRQVFLNDKAPLRTDESFRNRDQIEHHKYMSPLERDLQCGMVSTFRLDPMHLVYAGVFKRWLQFLFGIVITRGKINNRAKSQLSLEMLHCSSWVPIEFNRRPRCLSKISKYKATELRRILLYDGVRIFKNTLPPNIYKNYLLLHSAIYILSSLTLVQNPNMLNAAQEILKEFVKHSSKIFGKCFVVYNVHCLIHLADECRNHGTLESFSAFKFENFMGVMKRHLRSTYKPLHQLIKRDAETKGQLVPKKDRDESNKILLKNKCKRQNDFEGEQFNTIVLYGVTLTNNNTNSCFKTKCGKIIILDMIIRTPQNDIFLLGYRFLEQEDYYNFPIASSELGIVKVSRLQSERTAYKIKHFFCKCVLFPDNNETFVCIPLVHCNNH